MAIGASTMPVRLTKWNGQVLAQFKYADRIGARVTLVVGPDEAETDQVTVKNLMNGEQVVVAQDAAVDVIHKILASSLP